MTRLREFVQRLMGGTPKTPANLPRPEYSYTLYWTKTVRQWDPARRRAMAQAVRAQIAAAGFQPNEYLRRYTVPDLDGQAHSGLSLMALAKVIDAFEHEDREGGRD